MSATEDDTELRDLLIQNLENNGVLNKLKAEMRASVFLAMEEQDKVENKTPLINENLRTCLSSEDGRLVAGLIVDFLQVFNLDFTLAVFQPEINMLNGLDSRELVCRDLGLSESELNKNSPVLLELVRRGRHKLHTSQLIQDSGVSHAPDEKVTSPPVSKDAVSETSLQQQQEALEDRMSSPGLSLKKENVDLDLEVEDDLEDGDSFFDDPLPKPQKTYGWKAESTALRESPAGSQSETAPPGGGGRSTSEQSLSRNGHRGHKDLKSLNDKTGSLCLDDDIEYDDDFNSHRSEFSIGEEIEEVSIEGPDSSNKVEDSTQDLSVSQLSFSHGADYMEDVS